MDVMFLANRQQVIDRTTELVGRTRHRWIGMGRTAAWIKLPEFGAAIREAQRRGVEMKVVIFYEGDAYTHYEAWRSVCAEVRFFEHGYIRLLLFDDSDAIIAFPMVVTSLLEDREYFGYHISDERSVTNLKSYFDQIWEDAAAVTPPREGGSGGRTLVREEIESGVFRVIARIIERAFTLPPPS